MTKSEWGEQSFASTRWSLIARAADADEDVRGPAIEQLINQYFLPMRAHLIRRQLSPEFVDDCLQDFVLARFLAGFFDRSWNKDQRFRSFLRVSLNNFVVDAVRRNLAAANQPNQGPSLDASGMLEPECNVEGDGFDVEWARCVLQRALDLMYSECLASGNRERWMIFNERFLRPTLTAVPSTPYQVLVERCGLSSQQEAENILVNEKRHFGRTLTAVIGEYAGSLDQAELELHDLRSILARSRAPGLRIPGESAEAGSIEDPTASILFDEGMTGLNEVREQTRQQQLESLMQITLDRLPGQPPLSGGAWRGWTVQQLFEDRTPPVAALIRVRRFAKPIVRASGSPVHLLLYHAAIAAAFARSQAQISKLTRPELLIAVSKHLADDWFGPPVSDVFLDARDKLSTMC